MHLFENDSLPSIRNWFLVLRSILQYFLVPDRQVPYLVRGAFAPIAPIAATPMVLGSCQLTYSLPSLSPSLRKTSCWTSSVDEWDAVLLFTDDTWCVSRSRPAEYKPTCHSKYIDSRVESYRANFPKLSLTMFYKWEYATRPAFIKDKNARGRH